MSTEAPRRLRADAARNSERLVRAAREVFAEQGPDARLDEIARRAGVGVATLYRRFPDKAVLVRAVLDQAFHERVAPFIEEAEQEEDAGSGLIAVLDATMSLLASEYNTLSAAGDLGVLTMDSRDSFLEQIMGLVRRAQQEGTVRDDLEPGDVPRIMIMLTSVLVTVERGSEGWKRYLALLSDGLSPQAAHPLPPVPPVARSF